MDKGEIFRVLEEGFTATFIKELIPGILHNFANPLNGIMGRSKLLQRRVEENVRKMEELYPEAAAGMMEELHRMKNDIRAVNQESEYFFEMFRDVAGKFYSLAAKGEDNINISELLAAEMRFADFYLDFKHEIKKDIKLDKDIPELRGSTADLSIALWRIIRFAMVRALQSSLKEFYVGAEYNGKYVIVTIRNSGEHLTAREISGIMDDLKNESAAGEKSKDDSGLLLPLMLLKKYQAKIKIFDEENSTVISIGLPYQAGKD
jgi:signal transduction histidine kinase